MPSKWPFSHFSACGVPDDPPSEKSIGCISYFSYRFSVCLHSERIRRISQKIRRTVFDAKDDRVVEEILFQLAGATLCQIFIAGMNLKEAGTWAVC